MVMRTEKWLVLCFVLLLVQLVACERGKMEENAPTPVSARTGVDSTGADTIKTDSIGTDSIRIDSIPFDTIRIDSLPGDSIRVDSVRLDSIKVDSIIKSKLGRIH
jgi:hypothetical protein